METTPSYLPFTASFRDRSGYITRIGGRYHRLVLPPYRETFQRATDTGLYTALQEKGQLIPHTVVEESAAGILLLPEQLDFVSYPYEWCFSQYRDAALATLALQEDALERGFSLKDASAFNIQFHRGAPLLIDTLSFAPYVEGEPWVAYRQFCEHFLAPLALMALTDIRLGQLFRPFLNGIPLDLAARLLPATARLNVNLYLHLFLHAKHQSARADQTQSPTPAASARVTKTSLRGILASLRAAVESLAWKPAGTEWGDYYDHTNYSSASFEQKKHLLEQLVERIPDAASAWDCGGNTGAFSRILSARGLFTVCWDIDPAAVEKNYRQVRQSGETNLLPLLQDLTNPSGSAGWALAERQSLVERGPVDLVLALALVHHLAISNNVPLGQIAAFFARLGRWLIIEFVPKEDSQTARLLAHREDIFPDYNQAGFEAAFTPGWEILQRVPIPETHRTLYLLQRR